jgi:triacylglycerol lipase
MKYSLMLYLILAAAGVDGGECVVLLHGLGRTPSSMRPVEKRLEKEGYTVHSIGYPSARHTIEDLCTLFVEKELDSLRSSCDTMNFVTHSMGGIILRYLVSRGVVNGGRVVMLCPPNQGSTLADSLKKYANWLFERTNGPAGQQLGNDSTGIIRQLLPLDGCSVGIIAGDKTWEPFFSRLIPGIDDGKVAVEETKLPGMDDFIILNHTHTFMMNNRDTRDQIVHFLKHGSFVHTE